MNEKSTIHVGESLKAIARHYGERVKSFGTTAKAAGWRDMETQYLRFSQLFKLFENDRNPFSLNDLGCGYGALLQAIPEYLASRVTRYTGYDLSQEMIDTACKNLENDGRCHFVCCGRIERDADYTVASGIFNHHFNAPRTAWKEHVFDTISHMYEVSAKGIAFNMMSKYVDYEEDYIYYDDPAEMLQFCLVNFGRQVILLHDYPLYEFTILVRKEASGV